MFYVRRQLLDEFVWYKDSGSWVSSRKKATRFKSLEGAEAASEPFKENKTLKVLEYQPFSPEKTQELLEISKKWKTEKDMVITWG